MGRGTWGLAGIFRVGHAAGGAERSLRAVIVVVVVVAVAVLVAVVVVVVIGAVVVAVVAVVAVAVAVVVAVAVGSTKRRTGAPYCLQKWSTTCFVSNSTW